MATVASSATTDTNIDILKERKVLQFPMGLGSSLTDSRGNEIQYMMIRIITDEAGGTLRNDSSLGQAYETARTGEGVGIAVGTYSSSNGNPDSDVTRFFGSEVARATDMVAKKGKIRIDKVIVLPMPNNYDVGTAVGYDTNFDPGLLTKAGDVANAAGSGVLKDLWALGKNKGVSGIVNAFSSAMIGREVTTARTMMAEEGLALNPKKEVMFDNFGFRSFNFRYSFAPKNKAESDMVNEIVETLRFYALPSISTGRLFFVLPAEFQIEFMIGNKINKNIPRIANSFLSRINVNYAPGNVWASLPDGAPIALDISLEFQENELIDRTRVYSKEFPVTSGY